MNQPLKTHWRWSKPKSKKTLLHTLGTSVINSPSCPFHHDFYKENIGGEGEKKINISFGGGGGGSIEKKEKVWKRIVDNTLYSYPKKVNATSLLLGVLVATPLASRGSVFEGEEWTEKSYIDLYVNSLKPKDLCESFIKWRTQSI